MEGSGSRSSAEEVMMLAGWKPGDFAPVQERAADEQGYALCEKKIDAMAYVVGHPATNVGRVLKECGARLVGMIDANRDLVTQQKPYFVKTVIPGGTYPAQVNPVASVGLMATVTTSASVPDAMVYNLVKGVFDNFEDFKRLHPALAQLDPKKMITDGLTAPLHPGAVKYYKEKGWL
jgi:TRAP transporter TAXI family solute receptor